MLHNLFWLRSIHFFSTWTNCFSMAKHVELLSQFNSRLAGEKLDYHKKADSTLTLQMLLKQADLSNALRKWETSSNWSYKVMEVTYPCFYSSYCKEFFLQGDQEAAVGLPKSAFMDRGNANIPKCQITFIDFVVTPLLKTVSKLFKESFAQQLQQNITENAAKWATIGKNNQ